MQKMKLSVQTSGLEDLGKLLLLLFGTARREGDGAELHRAGDLTRQPPQPDCADRLKSTRPEEVLFSPDC